MLSGPPRLFSLLSVLALVLVLWSCLHLVHAPQPALYPSSSSSSLRTADPLGFSVPLRFTEGVPRPPGENYTWAIVVPQTKKEDLQWLQKEVPEAPIVIYHVDDPHAENKIPKNKGREAMVYLSYMIDHYESLPDTVVFMHAHRHAWHNNNLVMQDVLAMLKRLNHGRVARLGYMNLRCHHSPGCPDWIHMDRPGADIDFKHKPEEMYLRRNVWEELHPGAPVPASLSGVCCAQFAVSRDRIRQVPLERLLHYRKWLLNTGMDDKYSGRVFEYIWHFIFTGHSVYCPAENTCYCDGYGICMGGRAKYDEYQEKQRQRDILFAEFDELSKRVDGTGEGQDGEGNGLVDEEKKKRLETPIKTIPEIDRWLEGKRKEAFERGEDPKARLGETESWDSGQIWKYAPANDEEWAKAKSRPGGA